MLLWTLGFMYIFELVFLFSLDIYPEVELLDHMVVLFLVFWGTSILFSTAAAPICIPTSSVWKFPFLHILANIYYLWGFGDSHSVRCEVISHCGVFFVLFLFFWLHWVFVAAHRLSLVAAGGGYSLLRCAGFSLRWLLLLWSTGCRRAGFSSCGTQAQ